MVVNFGYLDRPCIGESVCGDAGCWRQHGRCVLALADGLGHGPAACHAAVSAMHCVAINQYQGCAEILAVCDRKLIDTRGAALAIAVIDLESGEMTLGSVGNIRVALVAKQRIFRLEGGRGILGAGYTWRQPDKVQLDAWDVVVMFSDGVYETADLRSCLGSLDVTMQELAERILTRCGRVNDDAAVLTYQYG